IRIAKVSLPPFCSGGGLPLTGPSTNDVTIVGRGGVHEIVKVCDKQEGRGN
ncbi:unnamed protein product, partial [Larinioides sclopetarius]